MNKHEMEQPFENRIVEHIDRMARGSLDKLPMIEPEFMDPGELRDQTHLALQALGVSSFRAEKGRVICSDDDNPVATNVYIVRKQR